MGPHSDNTFAYQLSAVEAEIVINLCHIGEPAGTVFVPSHAIARKGLDPSRRARRLDLRETTQKAAAEAAAHRALRLGYWVRVLCTLRDR
jgi:hypothetical protein